MREHVLVGRGRGQREAAVGGGDRLEPEPLEVDDVVVGALAAVHERQQPRAAPEDRRGLAVLAQQLADLLGRVGPVIAQVGPDHVRAPTDSASKTFGALSGRRAIATPSGASASLTAFVTAAIAPPTPVSPAPLVPSVVYGEGVT